MAAMIGPSTWRRRRIVAWLKLHLKPDRVLRFAVYTWRRFLADNCLRSAAGLSYATLLALVPLLAIGLAILSGFPVFEEVKGQLQDLILRSFSEGVVLLSISLFGSCWFEVYSVVVSTFVKCFLVWGRQLGRMMLCLMKGMIVFS